MASVGRKFLHNFSGLRPQRSNVATCIMSPFISSFLLLSLSLSSPPASLSPLFYIFPFFPFSFASTEDDESWQRRRTSRNGRRTDTTVDRLETRAIGFRSMGHPTIPSLLKATQMSKRRTLDDHFVADVTKRDRILANIYGIAVKNKRIERKIKRSHQTTKMCNYTDWNLRTIRYFSNIY